MCHRLRSSHKYTLGSRVRLAATPIMRFMDYIHCLEVNVMWSKRCLEAREILTGLNYAQVPQHFSDPWPRDGQSTGKFRLGAPQVRRGFDSLPRTCGVNCGLCLTDNNGQSVLRQPQGVVGAVWRTPSTSHIPSQYKSSHP